MPPHDANSGRQVVFDTVIPDHFALVSGLHYLERRYASAGALVPEACIAELKKGQAANPSLGDVIRAPWLREYTSLSLEDRIAIEKMRERSFGEADPLRGLGECAAIRVAAKLQARLGMEDTVGRRLARREKVDQFDALQVVRAVYRYCGVSGAEAWRLYEQLRDGTGKRGSKLISIRRLSKRQFDTYCDHPDPDYA